MIVGGRLPLLNISVADAELTVCAAVCSRGSTAPAPTAATAWAWSASSPGCSTDTTSETSASTLASSSAAGLEQGEARGGVASVHTWHDAAAVTMWRCDIKHWKRILWLVPSASLLYPSHLCHELRLSWTRASRITLSNWTQTCKANAPPPTPPRVCGGWRSFKTATKWFKMSQMFSVNP